VTRDCSSLEGSGWGWVLGVSLGEGALGESLSCAVVSVIVAVSTAVDSLEESTPESIEGAFSRYLSFDVGALGVGRLAF